MKQIISQGNSNNKNGKPKGDSENKKQKNIDKY